MSLVSTAKKVYHVFRDWYTVCRLTSRAKALADMPTYFPEYSNKRKSRSQMARENAAHLRRYKELNSFYKPQFGQKVECHPDTGIVFSEFQIPMFEEAKELVCRAHRTLYGIHSIGWDVAFTREGPVLIEGNDNWEISLMQACDRPLKADWKAVCK